VPHPSCSNSYSVADISSILSSLTRLKPWIFLFIPGLIDPVGLALPLIVGAMAMGVGISGIWRGRKKHESRFDKSAKLLLKGKDSIKDGEIQILFSEEGMKINHSTSNENVVFDKVEYVIEAKDIYLITYNETAMILQKKDLMQEMESFNIFIDGHTNFHKL